MVILTSAVLVLILLIGVAIGIYLAKKPTQINVNIPPISIVADLTQLIPSPLALQIQSLTPNMPVTGVQRDEETVPMDVYSYCQAESEEWAREMNVRRAKHLRLELGDWDKVLEQMKNENGEE